MLGVRPRDHSSERAEFRIGKKEGGRCSLPSRGPGFKCGTTSCSEIFVKIEINVSVKLVRGVPKVKNLTTQFWSQEELAQGVYRGLGGSVTITDAVTLPARIKSQYHQQSLQIRIR